MQIDISFHRDGIMLRKENQKSTFIHLLNDLKKVRVEIQVIRLTIAHKKTNNILKCYWLSAILY